MAQWQLCGEYPLVDKREPSLKEKNYIRGSGDGAIKCPRGYIEPNPVMVHDNFISHKERNRTGAETEIKINATSPIFVL